MSEQLKVLNSPSSDLWYHKGLGFKCTECGQCCSGAAGYVWVNQHEIESMAEHLQLSIEDFTFQYLRYVDGRWSLIERKTGPAENYDCIFLKDKKCTIYPVRPIQCKTFPWWPENLASEEEWKGLRSECEGVDDTAPLVPADTIETEKHKLLSARSQP